MQEKLALHGLPIALWVHTSLRMWHHGIFKRTHNMKQAIHLLDLIDELARQSFSRRIDLQATDIRISGFDVGRFLRAYQFLESVQAGVGDIDDGGVYIHARRTCHRTC